MGQRVPRVQEKYVRVEKGTGLVDRLVRPETAMPVPAIRVAMEILRSARLARLATVPSPLVPRATPTLGHAVRATTALAFRVVTEIHDHLEPAVETVLTIRAPRATARVRIVREAIARIVHAPIVLTATSRAVSGSPMGESVVRSARR